MAEYIEREAIKGKAIFLHGFGRIKYIPLKAINEAPAADVDPVRHGMWLLKHIGAGHMWECSYCHKQPCIYITNETAYCPNCGAKMDEDVET